MHDGLKVFKGKFLLLIKQKTFIESVTVISYGRLTLYIQIKNEIKPILFCFYSPQCSVVDKKKYPVVFDNIIYKFSISNSIPLILLQDKGEGL